MFKKYFLPILIISVFLLSIFAYVGYSQSPDFADMSIPEARTFFLDLVERKDPGVALATLEDAMSVNPPLADDCHSLVHEIGHAAYEKYGDFSNALSYHNEVCISGYMHGVIESAFSETDNVFESMKLFCGAYPSGKFLSWQCYHGIGHALMYYTNNDILQSLDFCDVYTEPFMQATCSNGVFMENFASDTELHPSAFLNPDDPALLCRNVDEAKKGDCYLYAVKYYLKNNNENYESAFKWCTTVEEPFIQNCVSGIGGEAIKTNISNHTYAETLCNSAPTNEYRRFCIDGMLGLYLSHTGSLTEGKGFCKNLSPLNQDACAEGITYRQYLFE